MTKTIAEPFPDRKGAVLQDGHIDRITGPRCMVRMLEGPLVGRYVIAHTDEVLREGTVVTINDIRRNAKVLPGEKP